MAHVFISYKHEDGDFAELLKGRLEKEGFETWMDTDIQGGEKWSVAIDQAIENSLALIVIMSPEARKSDYITYEWSFALGLRRTVIPILLRPTELHPKLAEFQYIDFTNRNARPWSNLSTRLNKVESEPHRKSAENQSIKRKPDEDLPLYVQNAINVLNHPHYFNTEDKSLLDKVSDAIDILALSEHPVAHQALLHVLEHPNPEARSSAAWRLGEMQDEEAVPKLRKRLRDSDRNVRFHAITALSKIGTDQSVIGITNALSDSDSTVRYAAAGVLGNFPSDVAIKSLIETLKDADFGVRQKAVESLGKIGDSRAIPALSKHLLEQASDYEAGFIMLALNKIGTPEALTAVEERRRKQQNQQ